MPRAASSTIAALCYTKDTGLDFEVLATELGHALKESPHVDCRVSAQYDDFVIFDLLSVRICLAHCNFANDFPNLEGAKYYAESLVVSVGSSPGHEGEGPLFESRADLCRGLVERVESHHPSDRFMLMELDEVFSEEIYDTVLEKIWPILADAVKEEKLVAESPEQILPDLERRFDQELAQRAELQKKRIDDVDGHITAARPSRFETLRRSIRPTHPAMHADAPKVETPKSEPEVEVPNVFLAEDAFALPPGYARETMIVDRLRYALYPPDVELPDQIHAKPLVYRATVYTINASVIAVSAPVGVALLTYFALGRENLNVAARVMAITGSLVGLSQTGIAPAILSAIV